MKLHVSAYQCVSVREFGSVHRCTVVRAAPRARKTKGCEIIT
jgi:hypothetical protein